MPYFLDIVETIPQGVGFPAFGALHLTWLAVFLIAAVLCCIFYRRMDAAKRTRFRRVMAVLLVLDELYMHAGLLLGGWHPVTYLPLHLCSINIFLIAIHAWKSSKLLDNFLYLICIPAAMAALLFPSWTALPLGNFMHWHSFTVHILLVLYPLVLTVGGDIRPQRRMILPALLLLAGMAVPILLFNIAFDTNYMFLMYADPGNPLYFFQQAWGSHLYGYPILIGAVLAVMYLPMHLMEKHRSKN